MKDEIKDKWIAALESGEFEQEQGALATVQGGHCALGVLCELAYREGVVTRKDEHNGVESVYYGYDDSYTCLPSSVVEWAGLDCEDPKVDGVYVSYLNDKVGASFHEIALSIKEHL